MKDEAILDPKTITSRAGFATFVERLLPEYGFTSEVAVTNRWRFPSPYKSDIDIQFRKGIMGATGSFFPLIWPTQVRPGEVNGQVDRAWTLPNRA